MTTLTCTAQNDESTMFYLSDTSSPAKGTILVPTKDLPSFLSGWPGPIEWGAFEAPAALESARASASGSDHRVTVREGVVVPTSSIDPL
jgi:hypothetical protein